MKRLGVFFLGLIKYEKFIFVFILLLNLLPVLVSKYTLTVDGPSHLYNARLIVDLLENHNSELSNYFIFNHSFSPNWSGHLILGLLLTFFPGYIAEKVLILSYLILFPIGVRMLLVAIKPASKYFIYFIIPFTHSFLFYYGFYNFHIGIVILFFALAYWFKFEQMKLTKRALFILGVLSCLIFFSHVFVYAVLLLILFITSITDLMNSLNTVERNIKFKNYLKVLVSFLPSLICFIVYLASLVKNGSKELHYLSIKEIIDLFYHVVPAKALIYSKEEIFTKWLFIIIVLFLVYQLMTHFTKSKKITKASKQWRNVFLALVFFAFTLPNGTPEFGFISVRFILFIYFILFIFLSTLTYPKWLLTSTLIIINYVNIALVKVYYIKNQEFAVYSESFIEASKWIEKYSTVLPLNYTKEDWLYIHSSNYLGVDNPIIIKDNYEAYLNYFPLKWRDNPSKNIHLMNNEDLLSKTNLNQVDYVYCYGESTSNNSKEDRLLNENYRVIYTSEDKKMRLYIKN